MEIAKIALVLSVVSLIAIASSTYFLFQISDSVRRLEDTINALEIDVLQLEALAKKEGKVVFYCSASSREVEALVRGFNAKYPEITVEWWRGQTTLALEKFEQEVQAGIPTADVIGISVPTVYPEWKERGILMNYESPHYQYIPEDLKDPGYWGVQRIGFVTIGYNTELVTTPPQSWRDLLNPEYVGKIIDPDSTSTSYLMSTHAVRQELGEPDFWVELAKMNLIHVVGGTPVAEKLATGEAWLGLQYSSYIPRYNTETGVPIAYVYPTEGVGLYPAPVAATTVGSYPNAAKLFLDYCLSADGQTLFAQEGYNYGGNSLAESPPGLPKLSELKILPFDLAYLQEHMDDIIDDYKAIFGIS